MALCAALVCVGPSIYRVQTNQKKNWNEIFRENQGDLAESKAIQGMNVSTCFIFLFNLDYD